MAPGSTLGHVVLQWRPYFRCWRQHVLEAGRHHANHHIRSLVERDRVIYDAAVTGETPFPERGTQQNDVGSAGPIVRRLEQSPQRRRHTQNIEISRTDALTFDAFRMAGSRHSRLPGLVCRHPLERTSTLRKFSIHPERALVARPITTDFPNGGKPISSRVRQRLEQDGIQRAENSRRTAYTECHRKHCDQSEPGLHAKPPYGYTHVTKQ